LILTMNNEDTNGQWMDTLEADWMLPEAETLTLPSGEVIPTQSIDLVPNETNTALPDYQPTWLTSDALAMDKRPARVSPSSIAPLATARIGEIIELGERLEITGKYDPATLGSALHAVIATTILGQNATHRVLRDHDMHNTISVEAADESAKRLIDRLDEQFTPLHYYTEFPLYYTTDDGQVVSGWIDLLVETPEGFVLIDHKASPRARSDWEEIALGYSGQLEAYAEGINRAMNKPVIARYIHFAVTGGMVKVVV